MNTDAVGCLIVVSLLLAACSAKPTKEEFLAREAACLRCYCASNATQAQTALLGCYQYAERCRQAGVRGIQYDEVMARICGRLYLVERRLGNYETAEHYLERYAQFEASSRHLVRQAMGPRADMEFFIAREFDKGLRTAWPTD